MHSGKSLQIALKFACLPRMHAAKRTFWLKNASSPSAFWEIPVHVRMHSGKACIFQPKSNASQHPFWEDKQILMQFPECKLYFCMQKCISSQNMLGRQAFASKKQN